MSDTYSSSPAAIVLAAGESSRMGQQKLLLPFRGQPMIACLVDQILQSVIKNIIVVLGQNADQVREALGARPVRYAMNVRYTEGMLSSVRCGLRAIRNAAANVMVFPGDQPAISPRLINALIAFQAQRGAPIAVPVYKGERGHPLLFSMTYWGEILSRYDESGLRGLMFEHPEDVHEMETDDPGVLMDIDTPEDYQEASHVSGKPAC